MPERDAKLFEIPIGQMTEDGGIDVVLGKAPAVLGHAELFEPVVNPLHRGPSSWIYRGLTELLDLGHRKFIRQIPSIVRR